MFSVGFFDYTEVLPIRDKCDPDYYGKPIPPSNRGFKAGFSVYDCSGYEYKPGIHFFMDECKNPLMRKTNGAWNTVGRRVTIRIVYFESRIACCANYDGRPQQAQVCNKPTDWIRSSSCNKTINPVRNAIITKWLNKLPNLGYGKYDDFVSDEHIVACMCQSLLFVQTFYPADDFRGLTEPESIGRCEQRIDMFS